MKKNFKQNINNKKGFTIVEALVAISILLMSITGPMVFSSNGLKASIYAKTQINAFYLAQDAMEQLRNKRDTNKLRGDDWLAGIREHCVSPKKCYFDDIPGNLITNGTPITECVNGVCPQIKYDSQDDLYNYASGDDTSYARAIQITPVDQNPNEVAVHVTISWTSGITDRTFTVVENLFNI